MQRAITALIVAFALLTASVPALAGGWATVRLDDPPVDVAAGKPWRFGFMVLQHDVSPNSDVTPIVRAINKETGEQVTATGIQEGPVGHFVAELTLPEAGDWKWEIRPEPYAETAFETLTVVDELDTQIIGFPATIHTGSCAEPGDVAFDIVKLEPRPTNVKSTQAPIAVGVGSIDMPLAELVSTGHAIRVSESLEDAIQLVCGDITGTPASDELLVGLQPASGSRDAGIAVLTDMGDRTSVTLYLLAVNGPYAAPGQAETIEILDNWIFAPSHLEASPGTTVTWVNNSGLVHMVTGDDLAFDDSGLIEPGQTFSMTFTKPGTYRYHCSPHPGMEGTIVIS